jgi:hypothetical protein
MKIALAKYTCDHCGRIFEAPMLDESCYGEFLLWSLENVAYMNAFEDRAYLEVKNLLSEIFDDFGADPFKASKVLQKIFGPMACDADPAGASYMIGAQPTCPACANGHVASWELICPTKIVEYDIPSVTHGGWDRLSHTEKAEQIERFVAESGLC